VPPSYLAPQWRPKTELARRDSEPEGRYSTVVSALCV
jgi:hypothetical protein